MLHDWTDDALRMDVPDALVKLLTAIDDADFNMDAVGLLAVADARRGAIAALDAAGVAYPKPERA